MMVRKNLLALALLLGAGFMFTACNNGGGSYSKTTGWAYNDPEMGGFEVNDNFREQVAGPGLVFIEGGTFVMGNTQERVLGEYDNAPRRVTISSFYMDETEVANVDYLEYLHWLSRIFGQDFPQIIEDALVDTLVWREKLAYNEPLVENYLRHPAYRNYPVVGVDWVQAMNFCTWRTDRVNEMILIKEGILDPDPGQSNENNFNTEAYLAGQYQGIVNTNLPDLSSEDGQRQVRWEDGILLPKYRLPTEAEWEYAALGLIGNTLFNRVVERRIYPWNGNIVRTDDKKYNGSFISNFKRTRGDYMGVAGNLNDGAMIPAQVGSYWPNDYGLYNMAGNVSEWVMDVYRPSSFDDIDDLNPFRGNVFQTKETDEEGFLVEKDSMGRIRYRDVTVEESLTRRNYRKADNINYLDGDYQSQVGVDWASQPGTGSNTTNNMYAYADRSLISDHTRVFKGGSWKDPAYFLSPSVRRYLDENEATNFIGFRCAMDRVGSQVSAGK
ncbi:MAG: gliding motility lipoprotein GldJ [Marinilabiliales bacterium]|nr:MAG: gliding motility lipoprotein GldJ [Marinilabiliales bacterium]